MPRRDPRRRQSRALIFFRTAPAGHGVHRSFFARGRFTRRREGAEGYDLRARPGSDPPPILLRASAAPRGSNLLFPAGHGVLRSTRAAKPRRPFRRVFAVNPRPSAVDRRWAWGPSSLFFGMRNFVFTSEGLREVRAGGAIRRLSPLGMGSIAQKSEAGSQKPEGPPSRPAAEAPFCLLVSPLDMGFIRRFPASAMSSSGAHRRTRLPRETARPTVRRPRPARPMKGDA
jgi:hypothetical protein